MCRLPPNSNSDALQTEMSKDICLQRPMDSTFKTISFPDHYSYTYYGSTSGAWRSFPGRDATDQKCANFECRRRPWYLDGISVAKQVKILIDTGNSMGIGVTGEYQRPLQTTYLHVAIDITSSLLQTLSPGDWVEVWSFNTSGAVSLGAPVNVGPYTDPNSRPELRPLDNSVRALTHSADPAPSDLATAITKSVSSFQSTATQTLKVFNLRTCAFSNVHANCTRQHRSAITLYIALVIKFSISFWAKLCHIQIFMKAMEIFMC